LAEAIPDGAQLAPRRRPLTLAIRVSTSLDIVISLILFFPVEAYSLHGKHKRSIQYVNIKLPVHRIGPAAVVCPDGPGHPVHDDEGQHQDGQPKLHTPGVEAAAGGSDPQLANGGH